MLDLNDYALIHILEYLDKSSKLQMMSVCKKFEHLIGTTPQLYRNFKLTLDDKFSDTQLLAGIRRNVGSVTLDNLKILKLVDGKLQCDEDRFEKIHHLFKKIGSKLIDVRIIGSPLKQTQFMLLMQLIDNVRSLFLETGLLPPLEGDAEFNDLKTLRCLKSLYIYNLNWHHFNNFVKIIPSLLREFRTIQHPQTMSPRTKNLYVTFSKLSCLESLELDDLSTFHFDYSELNCKIQNLIVTNFRLGKEAFAKFEKFIKIQKSVAKLQMTVDERHARPCHEEMGYNNYRPIFEHLLNLQSLQEFQYNFHETANAKFLKIIETAKIRNQYLKILEFTSTPLNLNFGVIACCFPNVTHFKLGYRDEHARHRMILEQVNFDVTSIKFMEKVQKLEISGGRKVMIEQIECKELREFVWKYENHTRISILSNVPALNLRFY